MAIWGPILEVIKKYAAEASKKAAEKAATEGAKQAAVKGASTAAASSLANQAGSNVVSLGSAGADQGLAQQAIQNQAVNPTLVGTKQVTVPGPEGTILRGQGEVMPQYRDLNDYSQINELGKVEVKKPRTLGSNVGRTLQSFGYGMIDKPLGRDANTWDYLAKTGGQIARLNEGSGLTAGQPLYQQNQVDYTALQKDLKTVDAAKLGTSEGKEETFRKLVAKYPKAYTMLKAYFYPNQSLVNFGYDPTQQ